jgi:anti-sigma-K factor RskA
MESHRGIGSKPPSHRRHWKRIHHSKLFWVGVILVLAAIAIYVLSEDLSWRPGLH